MCEILILKVVKDVGGSGKKDYSGKIFASGMNVLQLETLMSNIKYANQLR